MKIENEVFINQIIQNVRSIDDGFVWFATFDHKEKLRILQFIYSAISQAHPNDNDVDLAVKNSKLKLTFTPCVLIYKGKLNIQMSKILSLPIDEYDKIFCLLIHLLKVADQKRKERDCDNGCLHWWHKDLSNKNIITQIYEEFSDEKNT